MSYFKVSQHPKFLEIIFLDETSANALSLKAAQELEQIQKKFASWENPVIVSSAHPRFFCSGGNLTDYKKLKSKALGLKVNSEITRILNQFGKWNTLKVASVTGDVLGGGMEWLARFDAVFSTPYNHFCFWQKRIGLSPGWGGGKAWSSKIGEEQTRELLLEARPLTAGEALKLGLIDRVVSEFKIDEDVKQWCEKVNSPILKSILNFQAKTEKHIFAKLWLGKTHAQVLKNWKTAK